MKNLMGMGSNTFKKITLLVLLFFACIFPAFTQTLGDANTDGMITIIDALLTARYSAGLSVNGFNATFADVDKNSQVNIIDAMLIARYAAGLITSFPGQTAGVEPVAVFTISNTVPAVNATVRFDASQSYDPDGTITGYSWDFDDGTKATGSSVSHAFAEMNDFKVVLTVKDNSGLTKELKQRVFVGRPQGWTEKTHHKSADGDYTQIFTEDKVQRLDIIITPANYKTMEDDLAKWTLWSTQTPVYVPVTVKYNGFTWMNVGLRYKGKSTLITPKQEGSHKYPFHLNFDKYEDTYPEINDQRFYGFKELLCNNNWYDSSFMKDIIVSDIFREGGVPCARGAYYRLYVDTGSGPAYWGLYLVFEDHGDEMLKTQFADNNGNLYKPENNGAEWKTYVQSAFVKKTNEEEADYSDVREAVTALNASRTNAAAWRNRLDAAFNTTSFLRWLAINTAIVVVDSYGITAQNYFLYQDLADNGRLVWVPWDFNLSLDWLDTGGFAQKYLSFSLSEVSSSWPLIRYLMDDPVYKNIYHQEMRKALDGCFNETKIKAKMQRLHDMIKPYVVGSGGERSGYTYLKNGTTEFDAALTSLLNHVSTRQREARNYLNTVPQ